MVAASLQPQGREQGQSESQLQAQSQPQMEQLPLPPSERDLQVFEEVAVEGASTREVAGRHGVSQTRIVQIRKRVAEWMASMPADPQLTPVQRIKLAADFAELRADHLYGEAMRAWTASTRPQTECRGMPGSETRTVRSQHGDARYLTVAIRIAERQFHLAVIGRKAIAEAEDRVRIEKQREEFDARSAKSLEAASAPAHDYKYHNPLDRDCSIPADSAEDWVLPKEDELDASDWTEGTCDDMETRRREFLSALGMETAPVQPPVTDRNGMHPDEPAQVAVANSPQRGEPAETLLGKPGKPAVAPSRPLNRKERRARQKLLERKLRKGK